MTGVIINADDFGWDESRSLAIAESFEKGLITDTTIMANGEWLEQAIELAKQRGFFLKIGIHFNLNDCAPLSREMLSQPSYCENGRFHGHPKRNKPLSKAEKEAVYAELSAQIKRAEDLGLKLTHADSHHHIHNDPFILPAFIRVCREHGIEKVRIHRNIGDIPKYKMLIKNHYNKVLGKQFITTGYFGSLEDIEDKTIPDSIEIMVHPGYDAHGELIDIEGERDGKFFGKKMPDLKKDRKIKLTGYGAL